MSLELGNRCLIKPEVGDIDVSQLQSLRDRQARPAELRSLFLHYQMLRPHRGLCRADSTACVRWCPQSSGKHLELG